MAHAPRPWTVSATYVGTVAGAGFGSGRELVHFFASYGCWGLAGAALAGAGFAWLGGEILALCQRRNLSEHGTLFRAVLGPLAPVLDVLTSLFLFAGLGVVLAGGGALASATWGSSPLTGAAVMAGGVSALLLAGTGGMLWGNAVLVPLLAGYCLALAAREAASPGWGARLAAAGPDAQHALGHWYLGSLLYVGYNLLLAAVVLCALAPQLPDASTARRTGAAGGACLGLLILAATTPLLTRYDVVAQAALPLAHIAAVYGRAWRAGYALLLGSCLFTTALGSAYALAARLAGPGRRGHVAVLCLACALPVASLGLPALVSTLYPAAGAVGVILLGGLILNSVRQG